MMAQNSKPARARKSPCPVLLAELDGFIGRREVWKIHNISETNRPADVSNLDRVSEHSQPPAVQHYEPGDLHTQSAVS